MKNITWLRSQKSIVFFLIWGILILLLPLKTPFKVFDEGIAVFNATRILQGDIPYKDFWTVYPPGQSYTLAAIFHLFGTSLLVSRIYDALVRLTISVLIMLIAKKISTRNLEYFAFIASILMLCYVGGFSYIGWPALALSTLTLFSYLRYLETRHKYQVVMIGVLIGITAFFRWDFGLYVGSGIVATEIIIVILQNSQEKKIYPTLSDLLILISSTLAFVILSYGIIGSLSGFRDLWDQVVAFPVFKLHQVRNTTYPSLPNSFPDVVNFLHFYFPVMVFLVAVFVFTRYFLQKKTGFETVNFGRLLIVIIGILFFAQAISRNDNIHLLPTSLFALLVVVSLLSLDVNFSKIIKKSLYFLLLIGSIFLYIIVPIMYISAVISLFSPLACYSHLERATCIYVHPDQELAVEFIRRNTQEDETIFVGNQRHDLIFINDIGFYFLSARNSPSRFDELHPGIATTLIVQKEISTNIESKDVRWIVLVNIPETGGEESSKVNYLDDFIKSKYSPVEEFGIYQLLERVQE